MSNLSELLPAGGGQNNFTFTASGAVSNGDVVVLNDNGTVSSAGPVSAALGTASVISASNASTDGRNASTVYATNSEKIVHVYINSNYVWAVLGTVTGSTVSYETPVAVNSAASEKPRAVYDSVNDRVVVCYGSNAGGGQLARVLTISGNLISVGNATLYDNSTNGVLTAAFDESEGKVVVAWSDNNSSSYGKAKVGTVNDTTISFGSEATFEFANANMESAGAVYDSTNQRVVIVYMDSGNSNKGSAVVCIISGTSISFGAVATFGPPTIYGTFAMSSAFDSSTGKIVVVGREGLNSYGVYQVGTVNASNNTISFGTQTTFISQNIANRYLTISYDAAAEKVVIMSCNNTDALDLRAAKVAGTVLNFDSPVIDLSSNIQSPGVMAYAANARKTHICYVDTTISSNAIGRTFAPAQSNLWSGSFIGLAGQAISDTATGTINVVGSLNEGQSGLTIGTDYYAYTDGSLVPGYLSFDLEGASYESKSLSVATEIASPHGVAISADGTALYVLNLGGSGTVPYGIAQYTLSNPYDVSSGTYASKSLSVQSQESSPRGMTFKPDGTSVYVIGSATGTVYEYTLTTAWDISTASYSGNSFAATGVATPCGLGFNSTGTRLFVIDQADDDVHQYDLSTGFDLSTASVSGNVFDTTSQDSTAQDMFVSPDGDRFFVLGAATETVYQYNMATAGDLSTATYSGVSLNHSAQGTAYGLAFSQDGQKMYISGFSLDLVQQYTASTSYTDNKVGKAISATQINMKNRS